MALKDLVAKKSALTEEAIESIVADYVRYDEEGQEIVFTPSAVSLSNKGKILVYLVALQGWPFVTDEAVPLDAKPGDLEEVLGIPGGSLRPTLKDLKDRHLLVSRDGKYSVRAANLTTVKAELGARESSTSRARARKRPGKAAAAPEKTEQTTPPGRKAPKKQNSSESKGQRFADWIEDGFFDTPRTLADVQNRFHQDAILIPQTSIPRLLLGGVRSKKLEREKQTVNGKLVWVYRTKA